MVDGKRAWLLTWNPQNWEWQDYFAWCKDTKFGKTHTLGWTCVSKGPKIGEDVFLIKLGNHPRGIIAHGTVSKEYYMASHYDSQKAEQGQQSGHIDVEFDRIQDFQSEEIILQDSLREDLPRQNWSPRSSGQIISEDVVSTLMNQWNALVGLKEKDEVEVEKIGLNTILYGPPGTGKTYSTIKYAVKICDPEFASTHTEYDDFLGRYNELKATGRIAFTTFHQSYGYEEFIEGIKPVMIEEGSDVEDNTGVEYTLASGLFKRFCEKALLPIFENGMDYGFNDNPTVWKVSLMRSYNNPVRDECLENGHIRIGWDGYGPNITEGTKYEDGGKASLIAFINRMQEGDIVFSCYSQFTIDAVGVITGDYEWNDAYDEYKRVRKVNWIIKKNIDIRKLNNGKAMVQQTVYRMSSITASDVVQLLSEEMLESVPNKKTQDANYVFIIDEINRGNISKIFGELITLIEENKRVGNAEEMFATLPYSQKPFGVPNNVYILGTMNTADRSIALMDTALRRRFNFKEMMPDISVLSGVNVTSNGETLDIAKMLEIINTRIEYLYDREHTIGHAFFTCLKEDNRLERLAEIFKKKVIPLLQEYFYEDYEKIQLVLGDNDKSSNDYKFIIDKKVNENKLFKKSPQLDLREKTFTIQEEAFNLIQSYIEIFELRKVEAESE